MNIAIDVSLGSGFKSVSQRARLLTERWTQENVLCPSCGGVLEKYPNNRPVADFKCDSCSEDFELKASSTKIGKIVPDGAYATMMQRLASDDNPNLFLLQYDSSDWMVTNMMVIPKFYFAPNIIRKRLPLLPTAKRAGWVGCNILLGEIPDTGRIPLVIDRAALPLARIKEAWNRTKFLNEIPNQKKGWLLKTMSCIERLNKKRFDLLEIYKFERELRRYFPRNQHVREKLRQQLQVLRDKGYIRFLGRGEYELAS